MKKILKRSCLIMIVSLFLSSGYTILSSAQGNTESISNPIYFKILDKNGNLKSTGYLPSSKEAALVEMQNRSYDWGARTLSNGEVMQCFQSGNDGFWANKGDFVSFSFGLNRNAYIYSGISEWNGIGKITESEGLTGGRQHGGPAISSNYYYGFIRNSSTSNVTVTYASFSTPYL